MANVPAIPSPAPAPGEAGGVRPITDGSSFKWGTHISSSEDISVPGLAYPIDLKNGITNQPFIHLNIVDPVATAPRTAYAIGLTMPNSIKVAYNASWEEVDMGVVGGAILNGLDGQTTLNTYNETLKRGGLQVGLQGAEGLGAPAKSIYEKSQRRMFNNHAALLFKGMSFREFQMNWKLYPKSQAESDGLREILFQIKYAMHPETSGTSAMLSEFFQYPQNFIIGFYAPGLHWLFRTSPCALISMEVEYNGSGAPSFFPNSEPTCVDLSLHFKENEILTKTRIQQGW